MAGIGKSFTIELTAVELAQLEKLASHEERDPAELLKALALGALAAGHERRRVDEIMLSGRTRRTPTGRG